MPKGNYRSTRDRRKTQPGGIGGAVRGLYSLRVGLIEPEEGRITVDCVIQNNPDESPILVPVFLFATDLGGQGLELAKAGAEIPATFQADNISSFIVQAEPPLDGEYVLYVPPYLRTMTSQHGLTCMGLMFSFFSCPTELDEVEAAMTYDDYTGSPITQNVTLVGKLSEGVFVGSAPGFGDITLQWVTVDELPQWEVSMANPFGRGETELYKVGGDSERCHPEASYFREYTVYEFGAVVTLPP